MITRVIIMVICLGLGFFNLHSYRQETVQWLVFVEAFTAALFFIAAGIWFMVIQNMQWSGRYDS